MSDSNPVEEHFKKFLADNKIDLSALEGTKDKDRLIQEAKDQRTLGILKAVKNTNNSFWYLEIRQLSIYKL